MECCVVAVFSVAMIMVANKGLLRKLKVAIVVTMIRVAGSREVFGASVRPSESKFGVEN